MVTIEDLRMMCALQGAKSLAAAARLLDLTPPALTMRLKRIEATLGRPLVRRGTRGVEFTEDGRLLASEAVEVIDRLDSLQAALRGESHAMEGSLRVVAPFGFGRAYVTAIVTKFHASYPAIRVTLQLSESPMQEAASSDLVIHIGALRDSSWVKYTLAENRRLLCASPGFMSRLGRRLAHPNELLGLPCLCLRENDEDVVRWKFDRQAGPGERQQSASIRVTGPLASNDGGVVTQWAVTGLGIMVRSEWEVVPLLKSGKLVTLLDEWELESAPVLALTPVRARSSLRLQRFIDSCRSALEPSPWRSR